ncbi:MAG: glutamine-hydrolyzing carbamoyl-phosphate synthase small subunit [Deltaproteobacteria bacterium]|nr:glutamine-hydrolyzing carbamoyl-phosphate synthase small subunit [Deltaproteobacteria bacterium]
MKAILALEDGRHFEGRSFGARGERTGEAVFNTGMTGYQEVLTDPSYKGQIVAMTYPLIGNYGVNDGDSESRDLWLEGFVVKELSAIRSNWRSQEDLNGYLSRHGIMGIEGIDTRALTKHIRLAGAMKAVISTVDADPLSLAAKAKASPDLVGRDLVQDVTCKEAYDYCTGGRYRVVVLDCGVKTSILRQLQEAGAAVRVVPASATADEIIAERPDGVLLSNGPGDPAAVVYAVDAIRSLIAYGKIPLFGICLGQQLLGLALGGETFKLKFGHHGSNHPVKDLETGTIDITVQNHGFCVDMKSIDSDEIEITHMNLNDGTLEGIRHKRLPLLSVQFHPEAGPGPHDARHLFRRFADMMEQCRGAKT